MEKDKISTYGVHDPGFAWVDVLGHCYIMDIFQACGLCWGPDLLLNPGFQVQDKESSPSKTPEIQQKNKGNKKEAKRQKIHYRANGQRRSVTTHPSLKLPCSPLVIRWAWLLWLVYMKTERRQHLSAGCLKCLIFPRQFPIVSSFLKHTSHSSFLCPFRSTEDGSKECYVARRL